MNSAQENSDKTRNRHSHFTVGGRYELLERIGFGGTGEVFRARDRAAGADREVCVKVLSALVTSDHAFGLREEARLLARLRHANIVSFLAFGEDANGTPYLVLELIQGANLRSLCLELDASAHAPCVAPQGFLPDRVATYVACAVLRALAAVQRTLPGLVHRDVTPHNILVSNEGEVKLSDFGIALPHDRAPYARSSAVKGKFGYMAPEQLVGGVMDVRTDLFAVGVVLYELLAKVRPWAPARGMAELRAIERGEGIPLAARRPDIDDAHRRAVERLLSPRLEQRYPSADDALRALAPFSAGDLGSLRLAALLRLAGFSCKPPAVGAISHGDLPR